MLKLMMDEGPGGGHYDNIMSPKLRRIGVGIVYVQQPLLHDERLLGLRPCFSGEFRERDTFSIGTMAEAHDRSSGWIGTVLHDKWRIDAKIARGGVATVYRATHRQGQVAAIKIMHPELARNEEVRKRFLREGYAANKVGHPGVVSVLDDDVTKDGSAYIVMELLEKGEVLEDRRERLGGKLPVAEAVDIGQQILDVLATAHEKGIIHRDIKPENIFVLSDGTVKVLDFGIAHIKEAAKQQEATATGLLLGTPEYMSPEQVLGKRGQIDAATDIYAVGATLFTLLSGESVHVADTLNMLLVQAASRQARSLSSVVYKELPRALIAVIDKALALEKPRRWPSARAMQLALREAVPAAAPKAKVSAAPPAKVAAAPPRPASLPAAEAAQARLAAARRRAAAPRLVATASCARVGQGGANPSEGADRGAHVGAHVGSGAVDRAQPPPRVRTAPVSPAAVRADDGDPEARGERSVDRRDERRRSRRADRRDERLDGRGSCALGPLRGACAIRDALGAAVRAVTAFGTSHLRSG